MKGKTKRIMALCSVVLLVLLLPGNVLANESIGNSIIPATEGTLNTLETLPGLSETDDINQQVVVIYNKSNAFNVQSLSLSTNEVIAGETVSDRVDVLEVSNDVNINEFINKVSTNPSVLAAGQNYIRKTTSLPNDPDILNDQAWQFQNIGTDKTWDQVSNYNTIGVAVLDTGLNVNHPDLIGRTIAGYDYVTDSPNVVDKDGHGTSVSGCVAATANNGIGLAGVAGSANIKIAPYRVGTSGLSLANICAALMAAADRSDINIINMSYGGYEYDKAEAAAISYAQEKGKILVAASGNEGTTSDPEAGLLSYPASYDGVISVAATTNTNFRADFSQYNNMVDLAAPGKSIYTTDFMGGYTTMSGTSFASPIVAGACGVLLAADPSLSSGEVETTLKNTAVDLGVPGRDDAYGYGLIQLDQALETVIANKSSAVSIGYQTQIENIGWDTWKYNGVMSGTKGLGYRLEGIKILLDNQGYDLGVAYKTHIQNFGWENDWKYNGVMSGTEGEGLRLEAICIDLVGSDANQFDLYYRTHVQNIGWLGWAQAGEYSGTAGYGYRLEGIEIKVVEKGTPFDTSGDSYITNPV